MDESAKIEAAQKIHERARYIRGRFLNFVAVIERKMSFIFKDYFCTSDETKQNLFLKHIMGARGLTLDIKKQILFNLLKEDYPRYWAKNKETLNAIQGIIEFRNKLAHSIIDVSQSALERPVNEGISFVEWDDGKPITEASFQDWEAKANLFLSCLGDIERLLPFKEKESHSEAPYS